MTVSGIAERSEPPPYFFLSYARSSFRPEGGGDPEYWVKKLFQALCRSIDDQARTAAPEPGFMDVDMPLGIRWSQRLARALATCRVFVPLLRPQYFTSEYCGKEWTAFHRRLEQHAPGGERPMAIIPMLWTPFRPSDYPEQVRNLQLVPPGFPPEYAEWGFSGLVKLRRRAYHESIIRMAEIIIRAAEDIDLRPCEPMDLDALPSFFAHQTVEDPQRVRVTVAACALRPQNAAEPVNPNPQRNHYYGHTAREWTPYDGRADATPIAAYAEQVIAGLGHRPVIEALGETVAQTAAAPSVLLLDPWAAGIPDVGDTLRELDREPRHVLVPWHENDEQSAAAAAKLAADVEAAVPNGLAMHGSRARLPTLATFRNALPIAVEKAIANHLRTAPAYPPKQEPRMERPTLRGPETEPYRRPDHPKPHQRPEPGSPDDPAG